LADHRVALRSQEPDVVLDMIPTSQQDAQTLMDTFRGVAHRVVAISSIDVYRAYNRLRRIEPGPPDPVPLAEDAPLREQLYPYRTTDAGSAGDTNPRRDEYEKILVERAVMGVPDLPGTVLRLPMVYGPRDDMHRLFEFLKRMDDGRPAILLPQEMAGWRWTRGYRENMAQAIAVTVADDRAKGRIYNVGEADALTMSEWVREIGAAAGWQGRVIALPNERLPAHLRQHYASEQDWVTDTTRIRSDLGYVEHVPRPEALLRTVEWEWAHWLTEFDPTGFDYAAEDAALAALTQPPWRDKPRLRGDASHGQQDGVELLIAGITRVQQVDLPGACSIDHPNVCAGDVGQAATHNVGRHGVKPFALSQLTQAGQGVRGEMNTGTGCAHGATRGHRAIVIDSDRVGANVAALASQHKGWLGHGSRRMGPRIGERDGNGADEGEGGPQANQRPTD